MYIEIHELSKSIRGHMVLQNINLRMESGKIYGFAGVNGSGKTMLMRAICGLITPTKGYVDINGEILGKRVSFPESIGALIENPGLVPYYSAFKNLKILADLRKNVTEERINDLLKMFGLDEVKNDKVKTYSLGMKQKLGIAAALMEDPAIIVLDEPFNGLDENSVALVKKLLQEKRAEGKLLVLSCHDRALLQDMSDEIFMIAEGRLAQT